MRHRLWPLAASLVALSCVREMPGPAVCSGATRCGEGQGCVLGRCRKEGTVPVESLARRIVLAPTEAAVVGGAESPPGSSTTAIVLGRSDGETGVLLRFPIESIELEDEEIIRRALVVLDPLPGCRVAHGEVHLQLAEISGPWRASDVTERRVPGMGLPIAAGTHPVTPPQPIRLDVTELVRGWRDNGSFGIALLSTGTSASGTCHVLASDAGRGPRLEVFVAQPKKPGAEADEAEPKGDDSESKDADAVVEPPPSSDIEKADERE